VSRIESSSGGEMPALLKAMSTAVGVDAVEQRLDLLLVGDVDLHEQPADLVGGGLAGGLVDVAADDVGALGGEPARGGQADAAAGPGDDGDGRPACKP
jgi:hypothetical protein